MKNLNYKLLFLTLIFCVLNGSTRVAYTRPGLMMRVPTSSVDKAPYLFRAGFGAEIHNFNPVNTAKGVFFDMEVSKGFAIGFSAIQGGDTTSLKNIDNSQFNPPVEFGFHIQQRVFTYNDISLTVGLQDVVFQNDQETEEILSLNTQLLSFFAVLFKWSKIPTW